MKMQAWKRTWFGENGCLCYQVFSWYSELFASQYLLRWLFLHLMVNRSSFWKWKEFFMPLKSSKSNEVEKAFSDKSGQKDNSINGSIQTFYLKIICNVLMIFGISIWNLFWKPTQPFDRWQRSVVRFISKKFSSFKRAVYQARINFKSRRKRF